MPAKHGVNSVIELISPSNKCCEIWPLRCSVPSQADSGLPTQRFSLAFRQVMNANRKRIADLALKSRLPSVYGNREYVEFGGLMFYGADLAESYRRVAYYIDK